MKTSLLIASIAAAAGCLLAQETKPPAPAAPATPPTTPTPPKKANLFAYKAPASASDALRKDGDGASRGGEGIVYPGLVCVLTPKQGTALTTQKQPSLFAYFSDETAHEVQVSITKPGDVKPVFILKMSQCAAGIYRLNLEDHGIVLPLDVPYTWNVVVRPDQENASKDLISSSTIKRIKPDPELEKKLKAATPAEYAGIYAEAGIWYDSLAALRDQIGANKADPDLRAQLLHLFEDAKIDLTPKKAAPKADVNPGKPPAKQGALFQYKKPASDAFPVRTNGDKASR